MYNWQFSTQFYSSNIKLVVVVVVVSAVCPRVSGDNATNPSKPYTTLTGHREVRRERESMLPVQNEDGSKVSLSLPLSLFLSHIVSSLFLALSPWHSLSLLSSSLIFSSLYLFLFSLSLSFSLIFSQILSFPEHKGRMLHHPVHDCPSLYGK